MKTRQAPDAAVEARRARWGRLPERIRPADLVAEQPVRPPRPAAAEYDAESAWLQYSCLAVDLGL